MAVVRDDPTTGNRNIWTFDLASGEGTPISNENESIRSIAWSPDGRQVAYVSGRGNLDGIYRRAWDGTGNAELLFQYTPGADMYWSDWSADGRFLTFYPGSCSFLLFVVPLGGDQPGLEREAIEWLREEYDALQGRVSPDSRFMANLSNEIEPTTEPTSATRHWRPSCARLMRVTPKPAREERNP